MAIANRDLAAGTVLVGKYKKTEHRVLVLQSENGLGFELDGKTIYKSLSAAASAVMNGQAANGWRFWTVDGEQPATTAKPAEKPAKAAKPKAPKPATKSSKPFRRMKVQTGVPEGQVKYFCSACMKSFLAPADVEVQACTQGHGNEAADEAAGGTEGATIAPAG